MQAFTVPDAQVDVGHAAYKSFIKGKPGMGDYSVQQTFGWGLDPECKERMLKLMDEAKHDDHAHSPLPRAEEDEALREADVIKSKVDTMVAYLKLERAKTDGWKLSAEWHKRQHNALVEILSRIVALVDEAEQVAEQAIERGASFLGLFLWTGFWKRLRRTHWRSWRTRSDC